MYWYFILCFFIALFLGIVIEYLLKRHKQIELNSSLIANKYKREIEEKEKNLTLVKNEIDKFNNSLDKIKEETWRTTEELQNLKEQTNSTIENFNKLTESLKKARERELKSYYENELEKIKIKLLNADSELITNYQENKLKYNREIDKIKDELNTLKAARKAIIEDQKRQEEMEINRNFYMLQIGEFDKEDIKQLRIIEPMLHNKEVLNKLIFESYYRKPMTDMFGRLVGSKKTCGIYKITNIKNKKSYIGKSVEIVPKRWTEHIKTSLNIGSISRTKIHDAMKEYGIENFTFEILEECPKDKLSEREKYWIDFYETNTYGYNIKSGG